MFRAGLRPLDSGLVLLALGLVATAVSHFVTTPVADIAASVLVPLGCFVVFRSRASGRFDRPRLAYAIAAVGLLRLLLGLFVAPLGPGHPQDAEARGLFLLVQAATVAVAVMAGYLYSGAAQVAASVLAGGISFYAILRANGAVELELSHTWPEFPYQASGAFFMLLGELLGLIGVALTLLTLRRRRDDHERRTA